MITKPTTTIRLEANLKQKILIKCLKQNTSIQQLCEDYLKEWLVRKWKSKP
jgi:hypothetical protein